MSSSFKRNVDQWEEKRSKSATLSVGCHCWQQVRQDLVQAAEEDGEDGQPGGVAHQLGLHPCHALTRGKRLDSLTGCYHMQTIVRVMI